MIEILIFLILVFVIYFCLRRSHSFDWSCDEDQELTEDEILFVYE